MPVALIVEDEPEANTLLAMLIKLRGYRTVSAFNGREALEAVACDPPDVVFLDLMLPDVSGYDVCRSLKSARTTASIPVVVVTARVASDNRSRCYAAGADRFVPKPYTPDQIFEALDDARAWADALGRGPTSGLIELRSRDDGETARGIARLAAWLVARTRLEPAEVDRLSSLLLKLAADADDWGQRLGVDVVASLAYQTVPAGVEFVLEDRSGWFEGDAQDLTRRWTSEAAAAGVTLERRPGSVRFTKSAP